MEERILVDGKPYRLCLFAIKSRNVRGVPKEIELIEPEQTVNLDKTNEFLTAYIHEDNLKGTI